MQSLFAQFFCVKIINLILININVHNLKNSTNLIRHYLGLVHVTDSSHIRDGVGWECIKEGINLLGKSSIGR